MKKSEVKGFREQFCECAKLGFHKKTKFLSFEKNPGLLPAFPNKTMIEQIKSGEWKGIYTVLCGRFNNGSCSSGNPECRKIRGFKKIKKDPTEKFI